MDVVEVFGDHLKPCQTVMQSWYQLSNLYSNYCRDQLEFMTKIREVAVEGEVKFIFLIHSNNTKVREYLIDKADPTKTSHDFLVLARIVESQSQTESMSRKYLDTTVTEGH